jgi:hypothetical protein
MTIQLRVTDTTGADDLALIAVLTARPASASAFEAQLARQPLPHLLHRFEQAADPVAFVEAAARKGGRKVDAVVVDLRKFAQALPTLGAKRDEIGFVLAAFPTDAVDYATVEAAAAAGAVLVSGDLNERDGVQSITESLVDVWFGEGQSLSRSAK